MIDTADVPTDVAVRLRRLRGLLGMTQTALAQRLGISNVTLNRWENGNARPSTLAWRRVSELILEVEHGSRQSGDEAAQSGPTTAIGSASPATLDFSAPPEIVRLLAEAERLSYGHLFNPGFATETSLVDPLPHQRIAVYERMLSEPRLRFLLADDPGAGKTIMAGLYIREMLSRRLLRRVIIVPPAGLLGNWQRELSTLFALQFRIVTGADARAGNPFVGPDSDLLIVSVDTLSGDAMFARLQEPDVLPYELAVFDEAHKLAADRLPDFTVRKTDRYRLAEAFAGASADDPRWTLPWSAHHLLLLTATPHMGKDVPYSFLWRLLLPEVLSTVEAFEAFPAEARAPHFIRRTKEEMVRFDGTKLFPGRISDTLSYSLSPGSGGEQQLYDEMTSYMRTYFNRARILNRSAARLAMSVFQRRLASSTWALLQSLERRFAKLNVLVTDIESGAITEEQLRVQQRALDRTVHDVLEDETGDEEESREGREGNEVAQDDALGGVVAVSLAELEVERTCVRDLVVLARRVYERGDESKFEKLRENLVDLRFRNEKLLVFTEHRDTLEFLVRRLEGMGFVGQVARIHGGMDYRERQLQVEHFRRSTEDGGAIYMVCTDAAAEGINLQFCWLMVNYDIPWNPARLEQRMGRIHRYKQLHDPVFVVNLVAGETREGKVLRTLLKKMEHIRKQLGSDKVFDVIGRVLEGVSLRDYMARALVEGEEAAVADIESRLSEEHVREVAAREETVYGRSGDIVGALAGEREKLDREELRRLLPGYVRRFVEQAAPALDLRVDGSLDDFFAFRAGKRFALSPLWGAIETYPTTAHDRLTVKRPEIGDDAVFLRPGEPVFESLRSAIQERYQSDALRGSVFVDPHAEVPYLFHLARLTIVRKEDLSVSSFSRPEILESRLVGVRVDPDGTITQIPVEHLLLLRGGSGIPMGSAIFGATAPRVRDRVVEYLAAVGTEISATRAAALATAAPDRAAFITRGFAYKDAELVRSRAKVAEKARTGDAKAQAQLETIKLRQRALRAQREQALASVHRESELVGVGGVSFVAHALVVPTSDPEERARHDADVEALAVGLAIAYEQGLQRRVRDVSTPAKAVAAGLPEHPGFDLLSTDSAGVRRAIEVKGRAGTDAVELTENEWAKSCTFGDDYWLYAVFDCATPTPRFVRVRNPFFKLVARAKGSVLISAAEVLANADHE